MKKVLSKYKISWLMLLPVKGKATKRDVALLNKMSKLHPHTGYGTIGTGNAIIGKWFANKNEAISALKKIKGLGKAYRGYIITDKQFGDMKIDFVKKENQLFITQKQKKESRLVK